MDIKGTFGYIIGKKKRMMYVTFDADILWQILVREIYVLMKHYGTKEILQVAFENIKTTKNKPKLPDIEKCKIFTDLELLNKQNEDWYDILHFCQGSYINILESSYIVKESEERGLVFMLDFNKGIARYYRKTLDGKTKELESATLEEIMRFDDMPTKSYTEIVLEMRERFSDYYKRLTKIEEEIKKLIHLKSEARNQGAVNIELKVDSLLCDMNNEKTKLNVGQRVFYNRLKSLDLIDNLTEE
jgi:hypothetical protein